MRRRPPSILARLRMRNVHTKVTRLILGGGISLAIWNLLSRRSVPLYSASLVRAQFGIYSVDLQVSTSEQP